MVLNFPDFSSPAKNPVLKKSVQSTIQNKINKTSPVNYTGRVSKNKVPHKKFSLVNYTI